MKIDFVKMQAAGNDYIYTEQEMSEEQCVMAAKKLSTRRFSVGADGLVVISSSRIAAAKIAIYNADGSRAEMCGNALRCVARYLREIKAVRSSTVAIETDSGIRKVKVMRCGTNERYCVDMGKVNFFEVEGQPLAAVGNLHRVEFVGSVDEVNFAAFKHFRPDIYNTEAVQVISHSEAKARVYERGSKETLSCGSGACALAAMGVKKGYFAPGEVKVNFAGGTLFVVVDKDCKTTLTGECEFVFWGKSEL